MPKSKEPELTPPEQFKRFKGPLRKLASQERGRVRAGVARSQPRRLQGVAPPVAADAVATTVAVVGGGTGNTLSITVIALRARPRIAIASSIVSTCSG